jgi:hypothetical protein
MLVRTDVVDVDRVSDEHERLSTAEDHWQVAPVGDVVELGQARIDVAAQRLVAAHAAPHGAATVAAVDGPFGRGIGVHAEREREDLGVSAGLKTDV